MSAPAAPPPDRVLATALRADPARALLTFSDDATGERAELSVATFAVWVAKTAHLCRDDLALDPGARVAVVLPVHWQAAVWFQAVWAAGLVAVPVPAGEPVPTCDVAVVAVDEGGASAAAAAAVAREVVGLGLGPLGLPVPGRPLPAAVGVDYDREVAGYPDRLDAAALPPDRPALETAAGTRTAAELGGSAAAAVARWALAPGDRVLATAPYGDEDTLLGGLLAPLAAGGGVLLCRHLDRLDPVARGRRMATERVTAAVGPARFHAPEVRHLD